MTPLAKLVWIRTRHPQLFAASRRWVGIKELMLRWLTGRWLVDHSCASGTGLFDLAACDWDREALELAGIDSASLSELVPTTAVVGELTTAAARELAIPAGTRVVSGGGDGPLASLGVGAISPGVAAVSIGTSGALRVTLGRPSVDEMATLFCYALGDNRWTVGGATNNGGAALDWLASVVAPDLNLNRRDELLDEAAAAPPGSEGLLMLPYLLSERTPYWDAQARGAFVGLTYRHNRSHLVRATLEGVCQQLALVLDVVQSAGHTIREVRATGGFSRSALLRQMLADALGQPVSMPAADLGTSLGAAALGMRGLGMIDTLDAVSEWVTIAEVREPDPTASAVLAALRPTFASAYWALRPVFRELTAPAPPVNAWPAA